MLLSFAPLLLIDRVIGLRVFGCFHAHDDRAGVTIQSLWPVIAVAGDPHCPEPRGGHVHHREPGKAGE